MPKRPSPSVAKKAFAKAEADFATWLMMAKLGSFDDLPPQAQTFLLSYRARLEKTKEAEATRATIQEMYLAYYQDMGGAGEAPELARDVAPAEDKDKVVRLKDFRTAKVAQVTATAPIPRAGKVAVPPLLIFAGMVAAVVVVKFAFGF